MSKINNLVEIAKILIEIKEERAIYGIPESVVSRYPEGSQGIGINDEKYIVLNTQKTGQVTEIPKVNELKDKGLKYNPNFFFGTYESGEPDIIDEYHNKSKLINEAYMEVPFVPKDIYSESEFDPEEGRNAVRNIIDKSLFNINDFDDFRVEKYHYNGNAFDILYRCRCVFNDISGNESVESLLIKAFKVSNKKDAEYSYKIINNETIKEQVEELERKVSYDSKGEMKAVYSKISNEEYESIISNIRRGIEQYYIENSNKFFRLTRVEVKAIYCLRLRKTPIALSLISNNSRVAQYITFYSPVAGDFNVFSCPNCNTLSGDSSNYDGIKFHVDHDYCVYEGSSLDNTHPIGCTDCMERCSRCGAWHFKFSEYNNLINKEYSPILKRRFLKNYANKNIRTDQFCSCREHLQWVYDEMSFTKVKSDEYYARIVDKFLSGACKLVFINFSTGEVIADYNDYVNYLHEYLLHYLKRLSKILNKFKSATNSKNLSSYTKDRVHNFVDMYIINENNEFDGFSLESYIEQSIIDFKNNLADCFNMPSSFIKITDQRYTVKCSCCGSLYYQEKNMYGETYYNQVKNLCCCCAEASTNNLRIWNRVDDGVTFYKPKNKNTAIKTFQSASGEELYDRWLANSLEKMINKIKKKG